MSYAEGDIKKVVSKGIKSLDRATAWIEGEKKRCGNVPCPMPTGDFDNVGFTKKRKKK